MTNCGTPRAAGQATNRRAWFFGKQLLLAGCIVPGCSSEQSECEDLARDAWAAIETVGGQHLECSADSDCSAVQVPPGCWTMVTCTNRFVGNVALGPALADAANGVAGDLCERFESQSCTYGAPSCPYTPDEQEAVRCDQGKCVWASQTDGGM
jgi:hypothetical protein